MKNCYASPLWAVRDALCRYCAWDAPRQGGVMLNERLPQQRPVNNGM